MSSHQLKVWGVINITPDSFSDGGDIQTAQQITQSFKRFQQGIDIGAESTNPKAHPISELEERERLAKFLVPILPHWPRELTLSLDTYKLATIEWLLPQIPAGIEVVWNDVSGHIIEATELLQKNPRLKYICCHNPVPTRNASGQHMNYVSEGPITQRVKDFFLLAQVHFERAGLLERVIADPCFGFGKTREQNLELWHGLPSMMDELKFKSWLWGISRKSFLRQAGEDPRDAATRIVLDQRQAEWILKALEKLTGVHTIILRAHEPVSLKDVWKNCGCEK